MELRHIAQRSGRLSSFLKEELGMSSGLINRLKWKEKLFVNGVSQHTDFSVSPGDVIVIPLDEPAPAYPAQEGELDILYEDAHILAVDKPTGMLIHPSRATMTGTLANRVAWYYQQTEQSSAFHPVTRLDRDTFGIVLLAKNAYVHALLNAEHSREQMQKTYDALVFGAPEQDSGTICAPIARKPLPSLLRFVSAEGKPSVTEYRVLERLGGITKLQMHPITGRTHQLRVHCAYIGCPILGDPQYGSEESRLYSAARGISGQMLCAKQMEFVHPITGHTLCLRSNMDVVL